MLHIYYGYLKSYKAAFCICLFFIFLYRFQKNDSKVVMRPRLRPKPKIWYEKFVGCTFYQAGGFGNQIWRLASLYGIGKTLGRQPYIENRVLLNDFINATWKRMNLTEIGFVFPLMYSTLNIMNPPNNLTKIANFAKDCCKYDEPKKLLNISETYLKINGNYLQSYKFFHPYKKDIKKLLRCGSHVMTSVIKIADKMFDNDQNFKLCVHIRRGDFIEDVMLESKEEFVIPAIVYAQNDLIQKGYKNVSLIIIGNDIDFSNNFKKIYMRFENVYTSQENTRGEDMCFGINYCDSIILTASGSTFAWWISYLMESNGPVFYNSQVTDYSNHSKDLHDFDIFLPEWTGLTIQNGVAVKETKWSYEKTGTIYA